MRVKTLWNYVPLPANLKLGYNRITATKLTTAYFLLAVAYCICQVVLQIQTFRLNRSNKLAISHIINEMALPAVPFAHVEGDGSLTLCNGFPTPTSNPCVLVFNAQNQTNTNNQVKLIKPTQDKDKRRLSLRELLVFKRDGGGHVHALANFTAPGVLGSIKVMGLNGNEKDEIIIQPTCATVLPFVDQSLHNAEREDMSFVFFNIWTMLVVVVAILNESIPHVIANQIALLLSAGWAGVQISRTMTFDADFTRIVTNGSCNGINLLPNYLVQRNILLIAIAAISGVGVLLFGFFSFKLFNRFSVKSFERVESSVPMKQAYILVLVFSICLQLLALLLTTSGALWLDELVNGSIGKFSDHKVIYEATIITVLVILVPWLVTGWHCVRREKRKLTYAFLFICLVVLGAHGGLFASTTLRVTMANWTFFGVLGIASFAFLFLTLILGLACWRNFNLGLSKCLEGQEILDGSEKVPWDFEKGGDPEKGSSSSGSPNTYYARKTSESPDVPKMVLPNKAARRESILAKRNSGQNQGGGASVQRRVTFAERHNTIPLSPHPQTPESPYPFTHYHENPDAVPPQPEKGVVDSDDEEVMVQSPEPWAGLPKVTAPVLMAPPPPRSLRAMRNGSAGGGLPGAPGAARTPAVLRKGSADHNNRI